MALRGVSASRYGMADLPQHAQETIDRCVNAHAQLTGRPRYCNTGMTFVAGPGQLLICAGHVAPGLPSRTLTHALIHLRAEDKPYLYRTNHKVEAKVLEGAQPQAASPWCAHINGIHALQSWQIFSLIGVC
jgi:hypothetical protein